MMHTCARCATKLDEGCFICPNCGAMVEPSSAVVSAPVPARGFPPAADLKGLGGWLIVVAVGLLLAPFAYVGNIVTDYPLLSGSGSQNPFIAEPPFGHLVAVEIGISTAFVAALIALNVLFYSKKRAFPAWMIVFLVAQLSVSVLLYLAVVVVVPSLDATPVLAQLVRPLLAALIWIPYFRLSKRVKATFVSP